MKSLPLRRKGRDGKQKNFGDLKLRIKGYLGALRVFAVQRFLSPAVSGKE
jgi:hypothetical protein